MQVPYLVPGERPQTWGQIVQVVPPPAPTVWGVASQGAPISVLRISRPEDQDAEPFDITLSSPQRIFPANLLVPPLPAHPLEEMVGIVKWGQQQADASGTRTTGEAFECEVDWVSGCVVTVGGSEIELQVRRDIWGAAPPLAVGAYTDPGIRDVQALLSPRGARSVQPHRTIWHPSDLAPAANAVQLPPAFSRGFNLYSPAGVGTTFRVAAVGSDFVTVIGSVTIVSGTVGPYFELPSGTRVIYINNMGLNASPFTIVYTLAL
jgi:hypothetical protein